MSNQGREEYYRKKEENDYLERIDERLSERLDELEVDFWRLKSLLTKLKEGDFNE